MQRRHFISACLIMMAALTATITIGGISPAQAENNAVNMRRAAERTSFSNEEIKDGRFAPNCSSAATPNASVNSTNPFGCLIMVRLLEQPTLWPSSKTFAPGFIISIWPGRLTARTPMSWSF